MKQCILLVLAIAITGTFYAQDVTKKEKVVTVDVRKDGDMQRKIKIVIDDDGNEKVIEWADGGEIPANIKKQLEAEGISLDMVEGQGGQEKVIEVIVEGDGDEGDDEMILIEKEEDRVQKVRKKVVEEKVYKMVMVDDDGNETVIEWDGEGEMPQQMKEMMKDYDMDMELHEGHGKKQRIRMRKHKGEKGLHKSHEVERHFEGERRRGGRDENAFYMEGDDRTARVSDTYMGAQVGSEKGDGFVVVQEIIKDSPADKAGLAKGDRIHRINGARTRSVPDMMTLLGMFEPNDEIELTIKRNDNERKIKVKLAKRPEYYR